MMVRYLTGADFSPVLLCSLWHLAWTAPRLSPGLRPPP
jgi:hypothetical protein